MKKENRNPPPQKKQKEKFQDNDSLLSRSSYALDEVLNEG
jgi:hypothetical protein